MDPVLELKADHSPRLGRWTVVQREQSCVYRDWVAWLADPAAAVLCLYAGDDLSGVVAGRVEAGGVGRLAQLYVSPSWRRRYWGSRLAEALSRQLLERGASSLEVTIPSSDWALARFWDALGWRSSATTYVHPPGLWEGFHR